MLAKVKANSGDSQQSREAIRNVKVMINEIEATIDDGTCHQHEKEL